MVDRTETPDTSTSAPDLADLLRLHFEASRTELTGFLEQWAKTTFGDALTIAVTVALAGLGGIFILIAAVLAIGDALNHPGWGLLIVGGVLAIAGGAFALARFVIDKNRPVQELE